MARLCLSDLTRETRNPSPLSLATQLFFKALVRLQRREIILVRVCASIEPLENRPCSRIEPQGLANCLNDLLTRHTGGVLISRFLLLCVPLPVGRCEIEPEPRGPKGSRLGFNRFDRARVASRRRLIQKIVGSLLQGSQSSFPLNLALLDRLFALSAAQGLRQPKPC